MFKLKRLNVFYYATRVNKLFHGGFLDRRYFYALLRFNGRRVTSLSAIKRTVASRAPFILSSSSRDAAPDPGEQKRLLASRFIHAPLCCPVIDAAPNADEVRYGEEPSVRVLALASSFSRRRGRERRFCSRGLPEPFASHFDANEVARPGQCV